MTDESAERAAPPLFQFLALLGVALVRKKITGPQAGIALLVALTSRGTTGERATVDAEWLSTESGLSDRQVWRHFRKLVELGWFTQTEWPKRSAPGQRPRRARYRLTLPALDLSLDTALDRVTAAGVDVSHETEGETEPSDTSAVHRLTLSDQPCDIAEREDGTVTPSHGSPTHGSPTSGHSPTQTTGQAREADEPPADQQQAVLRLMTLDGVSGAVALAAVQAVVAKKHPASVRAYVARFTAEDVERWATTAPVTPKPGGVARCSHGINGGRRITGTGDNASRICVKCEDQYPAVEAQQLEAQIRAEQERAS